MYAYVAYTKSSIDKKIYMYVNKITDYMLYISYCWQYFQFIMLLCFLPGRKTKRKKKTFENNIYKNENERYIYDMMFNI